MQYKCSFIQQTDVSVINYFLVINWVITSPDAITLSVTDVGNNMSH